MNPNASRNNSSFSSSLLVLDCLLPVNFILLRPQHRSPQLNVDRSANWASLVLGEPVSLRKNLPAIVGLRRRAGSEARMILLLPVLTEPSQEAVIVLVWRIEVPVVTVFVLGRHPLVVGGRQWTTSAVVMQTCRAVLDVYCERNLLAKGTSQSV